MHPEAVSPGAVQIDASSHCQLACPLCPTADGRTRPGMGQGHLKFSDFRTLLDRNPEIHHVELSNYGEMFLNPQLTEILAYAFERGVTVSGGNGVNLNHAREDVLEAVVRYRVRTLTCSLDGATQGSYAKYRINGNLERVLRNIDRIREYRRAARTAFPVLTWQFVVFGHNEDELAAAREMAAKRGMTFLPRLSWDETLSPVRNADLVRIETGLGAAGREEFLEKKGTGYTRDICHQLWHRPVFNWDGRTMGCCVNYWQAFPSNVFETGLRAAANDPSMAYARQMLTGQAEAREDIPCTRCYHFEEIRQSGNWLTEREIEEAGESRQLVALLPEPVENARFAQAMLVKGWDAMPPAVWPAAGQVFRFGTETAIYFNPETEGRFTAFLRMPGAAGNRGVSEFRFEILKRPLHQEFQLNERQAGSGAAGVPATEFEKFWIL